MWINILIQAYTCFLAYHITTYTWRWVGNLLPSSWIWALQLIQSSFLSNWNWNEFKLPSWKPHTFKNIVFYFPLNFPSTSFHPWACQHKALSTSPSDCYFDFSYLVCFLGFFFNDLLGITPKTEALEIIIKIVIIVIMAQNQIHLCISLEWAIRLSWNYESLQLHCEILIHSVFFPTIYSFDLHHEANFHLPGQGLL